MLTLFSFWGFTVKPRFVGSDMTQEVSLSVRLWSYWFLHTIFTPRYIQAVFKLCQTGQTILRYTSSNCRSLKYIVLLSYDLSEQSHKYNELFLSHFRSGHINVVCPQFLCSMMKAIMRHISHTLVQCQNFTFISWAPPITLHWHRHPVTHYHDNEPKNTP